MAIKGRRFFRAVMDQIVISAIFANSVNYFVILLKRLFVCDMIQDSSNILR